MKSFAGWIAVAIVILTLGYMVFIYSPVRTQSTEGTTTPPDAILPTDTQTPAPGFLQPNDTQSNNAGSPQTTAPASRVVPSGFKEYRSTKYRFSLFYPKNMKVSEFDEGGGAQSITFENAGDAIGFQIFIVPYKEHQVSSARFSQDVPTGVMKEPTNVTVDGVFGTMFYSQSLTLGDTREIWFINNGYLYEVTTLKTLDSWLIERMKTWMFI